MKFKILILILILSPFSTFAKTKDTACYFNTIEFSQISGSKDKPKNSYEFSFTSNNRIDKSVYDKEDSVNQNRAKQFSEFSFKITKHKVFFSKDANGKYTLTFNISHFNEKDEFLFAIEGKYEGYKDDNIKANWITDNGFNDKTERLQINYSDFILFTDKKEPYDEKGNVLAEKTLVTNIAVLAQDSYRGCFLNIFFKPALYGILTSIHYEKDKL